ncbi:hypothetical protein ABMA28_001043 [Loxostege sticticalis]|uniref:Nucleic-acid-binding protein from transposon X-element n=1 Tax=Loxostege sticticalis TaxID=481309 RepID=A0ABD0T4G8_LOXSC
MSKRGKKSSNKRGNKNGKSTKPNNAKQRRVDQPSTEEDHEVQPVEVEDASERRSETLSSDSGAGTSILARYLLGDTSVMSRDLVAGPSTRDSGAGTSALTKDSSAGQSNLSRDSAGPSALSSDLGAGPSSVSRDSGAGPSTEYESTKDEPIDLSMHSGESVNLTRDSESDAIHLTRDAGAGPSNWTSDPGEGPSTYVSDSGAGPSYWQSDPGEGPSTWTSDTGAGPCYWSSEVVATIWQNEAGVEIPIGPDGKPLISSLDYDENLKRSIVASFLGVPKSMRDPPPEDIIDPPLENVSDPTPENVVIPIDAHVSVICSPEKPATQHKNGSSPIKEDSNNDSKSDTSPSDFKVPSSKLKRKMTPSDEPKASTSKQDYKVSTNLLDKPNGNQISQISSSISEKALQECVVSSSDVEKLADCVKKCEISTAEIRHVQDIEREIFQMDIERQSNNKSPEFGRQFITRLAASLLEREGPVVLDDYRPPVAWPKKKSRVPYVFLHPPVEFRNHMKIVLERNIQFYHPVKGTHYTKILGPSFEDQQKLVQYFDDNKLPYHTFGHPSEKITRVVIRGLSGDIDLVKLKEELIAASIPVERLHKMRYNGMHKKTWHIILAIVPHTVKGLRLLRVRKIFGQDVTLEPAERKTKQCHRCQKWGHAQRYCKGRVKCVKCAGGHFSNQCTRDPQEDLPSCANCGGDHTASYRGCYHCPDSLVYTLWQMRRPPRQKFPLVLATLENCDKFYVRDRVDDMSVN